jgi:thiol:disulfide interchange protein DsbD
MVQPIRPETRTNTRPQEVEKKIEWKTNLVEAYKQALKEGKPLVVEFSADWCAFCRSMDNYILPRPEVQKMAGTAVFAKVDPDIDKDAADMVESFNIKSYPTFLVLDCSPQALRERGRIVGYQDADEFVRLLKLLVPEPTRRNQDPEITTDEPQPLVA